MVDSKENYKFGLGVKGLRSKKRSHLKFKSSLLDYLRFISRDAKKIASKFT